MLPPQVQWLFGSLGRSSRAEKTGMQKTVVPVQPQKSTCDLTYFFNVLYS